MAAQVTKNLILAAIDSPFRVNLFLCVKKTAVLVNPSLVAHDYNLMI